MFGTCRFVKDGIASGDNTMRLPYIRAYRHHPCNHCFGWKYTKVLGRPGHAYWFFVGVVDLVVII